MSQPEITINQVLANPFTRVCSLLSSAVSDDISNREGYDIDKINYHLLSKDEKMIQELFIIQSSIIDCMTAIDNTYIFMKRFYGKSYFEEKGIDVYSYLMYHSDMLYYKIATIKDLYFKMVNILYELGLNNLACNWENIKKKVDIIKNPQFFQLMNDNYKPFFRIIETRRNKSAHEGIINHNAFKAIELNINITRAVNSLSTPPSDSIKELLITPGSLNDYRQKQCRKSFLKEIYICRYNIFAITKDVFSSFDDSFAERLSDETKSKYSKAINYAIDSLNNPIR